MSRIVASTWKLILEKKKIKKWKMKINLKSTFEKFNYLPWDQPRHFVGVTSARLNELVKFGLGIQSLGVHSQP